MMNDNLCRLLDDYLLGELPDKESADFEQHLRECDICRSHSEQQTIIYEQIKSASRSIPVPGGLSVRARKRIERDHRRRVNLSAACVAGAASFILTLWFFMQDKVQKEDPVVPRMIVEEKPEQPPFDHQDIDPPPKEVANQDPEPAVQISFSDNVLAVPVDSGDPTITLIQVYPVAKTHTETQ